MFSLKRKASLLTSTLLLTALCSSLSFAQAKVVKDTNLIDVAYWMAMTDSLGSSFKANDPLLRDGQIEVEFTLAKKQENKGWPYAELICATGAPLTSVNIIEVTYSQGAFTCTLTLPPVTVTSAGGLMGSVSLSQDYTCANGEGIIDFAPASGGSGSGYEYSIDNITFQSGTNFSGLPPGSTYIPYIRDDAGCYQALGPITVSEPVPPTAINFAQDNLALTRSIHACMTVVVPVKKIRETIDHPELANARRKRDDALVAEWPRPEHFSGGSPAAVRRRPECDWLDRDQTLRIDCPAAGCIEGNLPGNSGAIQENRMLVGGDSTHGGGRGEHGAEEVDQRPQAISCQSMASSRGSFLYPRACQSIRPPSRWQSRHCRAWSAGRTSWKIPIYLLVLTHS